MTKHPIYIPSKGRADIVLTAPLLAKAGLPCKLVVERNDYSAYRERYEQDDLVMMPGSDYGDLAFVRQYIKEYARDRGEEFHWQLDDDISTIVEVSDRKIVSRDVAKILTAIEEFVDDFEDIVAAGLRTTAFGMLTKRPYQFNGFVYSAYLLRSDIPCSYSRGTVEGIDFNLQLRSAKLCTVLFSQYLFQFAPTAARKGGLTEVYKSPRGGGLPDNTLRKWPQYLNKLYDGGKRGPRIYATQLWRHFKDDPLPKLKPHVQPDKYVLVNKPTSAERQAALDL